MSDIQRYLSDTWRYTSDGTGVTVRMWASLSCFCRTGLLQNNWVGEFGGKAVWLLTPDVACARRRLRQTPFAPDAVCARRRLRQTSFAPEAVCARRRLLGVACNNCSTPRRSSPWLPYTALTRRQLAVQRMAGGGAAAVREARGPRLSAVSQRDWEEVDLGFGLHRVTGRGCSKHQ